MAEPLLSRRPERRYEVILTPALLARAAAQAERLGISVAAYLRLSLSRQVEADEATDPNRIGQAAS